MKCVLLSCKRRAYPWVYAGLAVFLVCCFNREAGAQVQEPGWLFTSDDPSATFIAEGQTPPPPAASFSAAAAAWPADVDADFATDEIKELARGLEYDPLRIFNYVRNQIRYEHYYGCKKGAALTLFEKSGNDFDQCTLLVSLLREAAAANASIGNVTYKYGMMKIPVAAPNSRDMVHWLGVSPGEASAQATHVAMRTRYGGWPWWPTNPTSDAANVYLEGEDYKTLLPRVCVEAIIGGIARTLDPSFKTQSESVGIDINAASQYSQATLLTQAGGTISGSVSPLQLSGLSPTNLGAHLGTLSTNLANSLQIAPASGNASIEQIIGGQSINAVESSDYSSTAYFAWEGDLLGTWVEVPGDKASTIEISGGGVTWTAPLAELRGRRLGLSFLAAAPKKAQIWLDDVMQVEESGTAPGTEIVLVTSIHHPFRDIQADYSDTAENRTYKRSATVSGSTFPCSYAIVYAFSPGNDLIRHREAKLAAYKAAGDGDETREVRTETLNLIGLQWFRQCALAAHVIDRGTDTVRINSHQVGRVGQEDGFYIDVGVLHAYFHQRQLDETKVKKAIHLWSYVASALEHGVVEQMQTGDAVSTVDLITRALAGNGSLTWTANGDERRLQPTTAPQTIGQWQGTGYAVVTSNTIGMRITGGLNGGYNTTRSTATSDPVVQQAAARQTAQTRNFGGDPVDLATGAFVYDHVDLALGGAEPRGLVFSRQYNTRLRQRNDAKLGFGWTHQYYLRATKRSDAEVAFGKGTPIQAAPVLAATHAALDVYDVDDPKKWACAMLALGWAVDQIKDNALSLQIGEQNLQFVRQPNGSFLSPPGVPASLSAVSGGHELTFRHGNTVAFDSNGRGTKIRDPYNKELTLAYNGDDNLKTVTDCYGRSLTLAYGGGKLTGVSDGTGRSVSFGQDASLDHTTYTDPEGKIWSYEYSGHRLTKTRDPDSSVIVENIYDVLDRVKEQRTHGNAAKTWKIFYSGSQTVEQDPLGGRRILTYDEKGRLVAETSAENRTVTYSYDGQDHRTSATTPNGETATTEYNADHNPVKIIDPIGEETRLFYDTELRLDYTIDPRGKTTQHAFNTFHQPQQIVTPEGVTAEFTYYTSGAHTGLPKEKKVVTGSGTFTTTFEYDNNGYVNKIIHPNSDFELFGNNGRGDVTSHTDLRGFVTGFEYNKRRQLTRTNLPTVNGTNYYLQTVYDNSGNPWKGYDQYGNLTTQTYSPTQKPLLTTFADNETLTREYDERDWLKRTIDHRGKSVRQEYYADNTLYRTFDQLDRERASHTYDVNGRSRQTITPKPNAGGGGATVTHTNYYTARGELWKTQDPFSRFTVFGYDDNGNLASRQNRRQKTWTFTYNDDNQPEDTISPLGRTLAKGYDGRGLLHTVTEPSGQLTTYTPDALGRVDLISDPIGNIDFTYDDEGRVDTVQESTAGAPLLDHNYDALGRLIRYQHGSDSTLEWIYHDTDAANKNAFSLKYPDGKLVRYDFDARGRLKTVKDWGNRTTTYSYDNLGRLELTLRPNGTKRKLLYDDAGQIKKIEERSADNRLIALFSYPNYWDNGQPAQAFQVPALPVGMTVNAAAMTFDDDDRLATWNSQSITHDLDGNLTNGPLPPMAAGQSSPGLGTFGYDARNRLSSCNGVTYTYDAENLRTKVTSGSANTTWVMNPAGAPAQPLVRTKSDGTVTRYIWGLGLLYEEDGASGQTKTYHYDRRGSTVALSDGDGLTVTDRWAYGPYGERLSHSGTSDTPFQFNGFFGVQTDANGLLYMNARYYHVELRRFISADPLGFAASANFYWFADADPFSLADPFGHGAADSSGSSGWTRLWGGVRAAGGILEAGAGITLGVATSWTGIGAVAGGAVALHGADQAVAGFRQLWTGQATDSFTSSGLQAAGLSRTQANLVDAGISIVGTAGTSVTTASIRSAEIAAAKTAGGYSDDLLRAAQKEFPGKAGKIELHHIEPKYLGGDPKGALAPLDAAYHQQITNEFRRLAPYGEAPLSPAEVQRIMQEVYKKYPLPGN